MPCPSDFHRITGGARRSGRARIEPEPIKLEDPAMKTTTPAMFMHRALTAAVAAGSAVLLSTAALAHDPQPHAAMDHSTMDHSTMDHSKHAAMAAAAGTEGYKRSLLSSVAIPDVVLTDADARPVRLRDLLSTGDAVMVNFIFTTCTTICPVMTQVFADTRAELGGGAKKVRMVSISIDPENDTPARLKAYAHKFGADAHWIFLTGRVEDVASVQRAFNAYSSDKMEHTPLTLFLPARGRSWVRMDGFATPSQLVAEYRGSSAQ
jgi:protein SCO1/2